jgi:predicted nucleotidyltransferase
MVDRNTPGVLVPIPLPEERVFRNQAMDDILALLYRNPHDAFGVRELRDVTGHGAQTVDTALDLFAQLDLIETRREGNRKLVSINRDRIQKPDDPILAIPQEPFRTPVKAFLDELQEQQDNLVGILVFGSVARGEADRASDIDLFIVVEDELMASRRAIQDIEMEVSNRTFDGDRFEFQVMVESMDIGAEYGEKLRTIFTEGITIYETDDLDELRRGVLHGE